MWHQGPTFLPALMPNNHNALQLYQSQPKLACVKTYITSAFLVFLPQVGSNTSKAEHCPVEN